MTQMVLPQVRTLQRTSRLPFQGKVVAWSNLGAGLKRGGAHRIASVFLMESNCQFVCSATIRSDTNSGTTAFISVHSRAVAILTDWSLSICGNRCVLQHPGQQQIAVFAVDHATARHGGSGSTHSSRTAGRSGTVRVETGLAGQMLTSRHRGRS